MANNTYSQKGQVKDLSDIVTNIDPTITPFMAMIGTDTTDQRTFSWTQEALDPINKTAAVEGADAPAAVDNYLVERDNFTQILTSRMQLTGSSMSSRVAGNRQTAKAQAALKTKSLKRSVEAVLLSGQVKAAGTAVAARQSASAQALVAASATKDLAATTLTEDKLLGYLSSGRKVGAFGGNDNVILVSVDQKLSLDKALNVNRTVNVDTSKFNERFQGVQTYRCSYGTFEIHESDLIKNDAGLKTSDVIIFKPSEYTFVTMEGRGFFSEKLAKTGDSESWMFGVEFGLKLNHDQSAMVLTNVKDA